MPEGLPWVKSAATAPVWQAASIVYRLLPRKFR